MTFRAGFATFVGRPNVGKSTLTNALVGEKIAITSATPQTTRRAIRGIVSRPDGQLVLVDTPGVHRPRTLLGERLNALVEETLAGVDVIAFCVPATERIGPGDRYIAERTDAVRRARRVAVVTKTDLAGRTRTAEQLLAVSELRDWDAIVPVSAVAGERLDVLADQLLGLLPASPPLYPEATTTDEQLADRIAELVREAVLGSVTEEVPHSLAVTIDEIAPREDGRLTDVFASLWVERDSQKAIVIGRGGARLKETGTRARPAIEALVGMPVYLSIHVKVAREWQRDAKQLNRLGF